MMAGEPIPMILFCPRCGVQHVDAASGDWDNPPHRSHLCGACGHVWRPADVPTCGVLEIGTRGAADTSPAVRLRSTTACTQQERERLVRWLREGSGS